MQKRIIPVFLALALLVCGVLSVLSIHRVQSYARVINYAGVIRGGTQQLVKEELQHKPNDGLMDLLDGVLTQLRTGEGDYSLVRLDSGDFQELLAQLQAAWEEMRAEIRLLRAGGDGQRLYEQSEAYFELANRAVHAAEEYTARQVREAEIGILALVAVFVAVTGILVWRDALQDKRQKALLAGEDENLRRKERLDRMSETIRAPMNEISELIYICDMETYELLFLNETGRRTFQVEGDLAGRKCYEVLQGRDSPCPFCNSHLLRPGENYTWEHTNGVTGRHYLLKDRLVEWEGRQARMELAFDMTEAEQRKQEIQLRLDMEKLLVDCVRTLYQEAAFEVAVSHMLEQLGRFLSADRTYIFLMHDGQMDTEYEWCAEGVNPQIEALQALPLSLIEEWMPNFDREECVVIEDVEQRRKVSPAEYAVLRAQDIHSLVAAPLELDGKLAGFLGVDNPPPERLKDIAPLLQALCYFLMLAWQRWQNERALARMSYYDPLTQFYNRNRYMEDVEGLLSFQGAVGIIYLDVNGLKDMNDQHGHDFGDRVLRQCADLIREVFPDDGLYRIGGDEFVILCPGAEQRSFEARAAALRRRFQEDWLCHAAIGVRWAEDSAQVQQSIADADAEMYEDKKSFYRASPVSQRYRHTNDEDL